MNIIYNKTNGLIIMGLEKWRKKGVFFYHYPKEYKDNLGEIPLPKDIPLNIILNNYRVEDDKLVKLTNKEKSDLNLFGRILTEDEEVLYSMKPTQEEIENSKQTVKILNLIKEVI